MVETLLIITVILLIVLIALTIYLIVKKNGLNNNNIKNELEDSRVRTLSDLKSNIKEQNQEIEALKLIVLESISNFKQSNQKEIVNFLNQTKESLTVIKHNFDLKTEDVNNKNKEQVAELIIKTNKDLNDLKALIIKEMNETNLKNNENVNTTNLKTQENINKQILELKEQVKKTLESGFLKNEKTMHDFIEKMALLEASSRQMESLQKEITKFSQILNDQKARGNFGEEILENIFLNIFGDDKDNFFYQKQVNLTKTYNAKEITTPNGKIQPTVDFIYYINTNDDKLPLSIDAKFPYTNYIKLLEEGLPTLERDNIQKQFKSNVKERIKEVSKYIIEGITAPYAIMFIPAEAIFMEIYKTYPELVEEARNKRIILASPSLIITIIQMMQVILKDYKKRSNTDKILNLIDGIDKEFKRFVDRFEKHKKIIDNLNESSKELDITHGKIVKHLDLVKEVSELKENKEIE